MNDKDEKEFFDTFSLDGDSPVQVALLESILDWIESKKEEWQIEAKISLCKKFKVKI